MGSLNISLQGIVFFDLLRKPQRDICPPRRKDLKLCHYDTEVDKNFLYENHLPGLLFRWSGFNLEVKDMKRT